MPTPPDANATAAIRKLAERGYEATTAGDLAEAVGMSRSTFFRRFGSKDDVIFADHDHALARLREFLDSTALPPEEAVIRGTVDVLHFLTRDPDAALLRSELLRRTPALRERELVITHRYERLIADHLAAAAPDDAPRWVPLAAAAGVVAVHNAALRAWLHDPDPRLIGTLDRELHALLERFSPWFGDPAAGRVLVAVYDAPGPAERILSAVRSALDA